MGTLTKLLIAATASALAVRYVTRAAEASRASGGDATGSPAQADQQLRDRIERHLASQITDADAIEVVVNAGDVSLRGELPSDDVALVLDSVLALPGVKHIHNRLTPLEPGIQRSTIQDAMQPV